MGVSCSATAYAKKHEPQFLSLYGLGDAFYEDADRGVSGVLSSIGLSELDHAFTEAECDTLSHGMELALAAHKVSGHRPNVFSEGLVAHLETQLAFIMQQRAAGNGAVLCGTEALISYPQESTRVQLLFNLVKHDAAVQDRLQQLFGDATDLVSIDQLVDRYEEAIEALG